MIDSGEFSERLRQALTQRAVPHFQEAVDYARTNGLQADLQFNQAPPALQLTLVRPSDGVACRYRIAADSGAVLHEKTYGAEVQRLQASLDSVNQTLVETELAAFFIKAAALPLDYVAQRHQPGFF